MEIKTFKTAEKINNKINQCEQTLDCLRYVRNTVKEHSKIVKSIVVYLANCDNTDTHTVGADINAYTIGEIFSDDVIDYLIRRLEMESSKLQTEFKKL